MVRDLIPQPLLGFGGRVVVHHLLFYGGLGFGVLVGCGVAVGAGGVGLGGGGWTGFVGITGGGSTLVD